MSEAGGEVVTRYEFDVFLSYADMDIDFARRLVKWLRQINCNVWIAEEQLVPGSQFRAGLQQGLRESRHMAVILTHSYANRPWTQREIDLFDLNADHSRRRILAIQTDGFLPEELDQTFLVHQRIQWGGKGFDPEAFWLLNCGLLGRRPGIRQQWNANGVRLLESSHYSISSNIDQQFSRPIRDTDDPDFIADDLKHARRTIDAEMPSWKSSLGEPRDEFDGSSAESIIPGFYQGFMASHAELKAMSSATFTGDNR
jgi:hypothetical protein